MKHCVLTASTDLAHFKLRSIVDRVIIFQSPLTSRFGMFCLGNLFVYRAFLGDVRKVGSMLYPGLMDHTVFSCSTSRTVP